MGFLLQESGQPLLLKRAVHTQYICSPSSIQLIFKQTLILLDNRYIHVSLLLFCIVNYLNKPSNYSRVPTSTSPMTTSPIATRF